MAKRALQQAANRAPSNEGPATTEDSESNRYSEPDGDSEKNSKKGHVVTASPLATELPQEKLLEMQKQALTAIEAMVGHELALVSSRIAPVPCT
jgi:hypothetical protein